MASNFFSLQPNQPGQGLARFQKQGADLPHAGSSTDYLDPSKLGGETLHSPFEDESTQQTQGLEGSSLMHPSLDQNNDPGSVSSSGGGYQSNVTGTQFKLPGMPTGPQQRRTSPTGSQYSSPMSEEAALASQAIGTVKSGLNAYGELSRETNPTTGTTGSVKDYAQEQAAGDFSPSQVGDMTSMTPSQLDDFIRSLNVQEGGYLQGQGQDNALQGFDLGFDNSLIDPTTGTRSTPGADWMDKVGLQDVGSALNVGQAALTGDPAAILQALNKTAPTVAKYITENADAINKVGNVSSVLAGAYQLTTGIQTQDAGKIINGIGSLVQGGGHLVGIDVLSQLTGATPEALSTALGAVGGLGAAYGFAKAIENGDVGGALMSAVQVYSSLSTVAPQVFTPLSELAASALAAVAPELAASLGITAGVIAGTEAGAIATEAAALGVGAASNTGALLGAVAAPLAVVAIVIMAVTAWIGAHDEAEARRSGWWNNPIRGQLYSSATEGIARANSIADDIDKFGVENIDTQDLMQGVTMMANSIMPYYATAQGGAGAVRASESAGSPGTQSVDQYQHNFQTASARLASTIKELMRRGMTYEEIGQLPVNGDWSLQSLDAGNRPDEMLWRLGNYNTPAPGQTESRFTEGQRLAGLLTRGPTYISGYNSGQGGSDPIYSEMDTNAFIDSLLGESLGSSMLAPESVTHASGLMTEMYGGPMWTALARMGIPDQEIMALINQHFDPWVNSRTWDPATRQQHYRNEAAANNAWAGTPEQYQAFTSGGM